MGKQPWAVREDVLECLRASTEISTTWQAARCPQLWAAKVGVPDVVRSQLPSGLMSREELKALCADITKSDEACFAAIMAWGAMKYDHGRLAWPHAVHWAPIVGELRAGKLARKAAYERFREMRARNRNSGMGPAYFTKLIFFADPRHDGYIMDQWTSLGINLLSAVGPLVHMTTSVYRGRRTDTVSDRNDGNTYERFCSAIEEIGSHLGCTAEVAEQYLFSQGGREPAPWRRFVQHHRP